MRNVISCSKKAVNPLALDSEHILRLIEDVSGYLKKTIFDLNRVGGLEDFLVRIGYESSKQTADSSRVVNPNTQKILVIGYSQVRDKELRKIASNLGISRRQIDFVLGENSEKFDFRRLRGTTEYSDVIVGALPHKGKGLTDYSSVIVMMESEPANYPNVLRAVTNSGELKITKDNIEKAIEDTTLYKAIFDI